jgi:VCBS repeat protein
MVAFLVFGLLQPAAASGLGGMGSTRTVVGSLTQAASGDPPAIRFEPTVQRALDARVPGVAVADVTGDGLADVIAATGTSCGCTLNVIAQKPNGQLAASPQVLATSDGFSGERGLAAGDLDNDGDTDIVLALATGIDVFLQDAGTLQPAVYTSTSSSSDEVEIVDINGDDLGDIVIDGYPEAYLLVNNGAGFDDSTIAGSGAFSEIETGDVTGDGLPDLVGAISSTLYVFPNDGLGGFASSAQYLASASIGAIALGDANDDGRLDVMAGVGGNASSKMNVFEQTAGGVLAPRIVYESKDIPDTAEVVDLNDDHRDDLVIGHGTWESVGVYLQRDDGTFAKEKLYSISYQNFENKGIAAGDINGDGMNDVVFGDSTGQLMLMVQEAELSVKAPHKVGYQKDASWRVHLGNYATTSNPTVRVYKEVDGNSSLIKKADVNGAGDIKGTLHNLKENVEIRAEWGGDSRSAPVTTSRSIGVAVKTTGHAVGFYGHAGKYLLFHPGETVSYVGKVIPNHKGKQLLFELESHKASGWKLESAISIKILANSTATALAVGLKTGALYRIRANFEGDNDHFPDIGPWSYIKLI